MQTMDDVSFLSQEYRSMIEDGGVLDRESLIQRLVQDADWTDRGAEVLLYLAEQYGFFVLRNALALSLALGIENGDAGL